MKLLEIKKLKLINFLGITLLIFLNFGCSKLKEPLKEENSGCSALECHPATLLQKRTPETGKHSVHLARGFDCTYCHYNYIDNKNHKNGKLDVDSSAVIVYFNSTASRTDLTTYWDNSSSTCNNLKCHGSLNWYTTSTLTCIDCHASGTTIDPLTSGAHSRHVTDAAYDCEECHKDYRTDSSHMNGQMDIPSGSPDMIKFNSAMNPSGSYTVSSKTCTDLACHGLSLSSQGTDITPEWDKPSTGACGTCHDVEVSGGADLVVTSGSHESHFDTARGPGITDTECGTCHSGEDASTHADGTINFNDSKDFSNTAVCDTCHSPGGSYDGVNDPDVGAKNVWISGVYTGDALISGKEKWCVTCHDNSPSVIDGVTAPNIAGDESGSFTYGTGYGYYKTGHGLDSGKTYPASGGVVFGAGIGCDGCHDLAFTHIDGAARTFDCGDGCDSSEYRQSYRLDMVGGLDPMEMPRTSVSPRIQDASFTLCFTCHTSTLFTDSGNANTNFRITGYDNLHWTHLDIYNQRYRADWTDYETLGVNSRISCVTCHNVHGSTNLVMLRTGTLINKEPGLKIWYDNNSVITFKSGVEPSPNNITLIDSTGYYWHESSASNICSPCHGGWSQFDRVPNWSGEMPVLTWTLETNYIADGVYPTNVGSGQTAEFRVKYTDQQNNAPAVIELWIDLNDDGDYNDIGEKNAISGADGGDTDYTDGKIYTVTLTVDYPAGVTDSYINYRFYATDGTNTATGTPTGNTSLRIDENNAHDVPSEYSTIQAAIDDTDNDNITTVLVDDGTYMENINFGGRAITVKSVNGSSLTAIDGGSNGSVAIFNSGETSSSVLDGFTIQNGGGVMWGGGIFIDNSSPLIRNCYFTSNSVSAHGAGIYMSGSSSTVENCTFSNNSAIMDGVIYINSSAAVITNCIFTNNSVRYGGGIYVRDSGSTVNISDTSISDNTAKAGTTGFGGGLCINNSTVAITNINISGNSAYQFGGGVYITGSSNVTISGNSVINGNSTDTLDGGGIYVNGSILNITGGTVNNNIGRNGSGICLVSSSSAVITGVAIKGNSNTIATNGSGGGIIITNSTATIDKSIMTGNSNVQYGGGLYIADTTSAVEITNSIIADNRAEYFSYSEGGGFSLDNASLILMNCTVADNISQRNGSAIRTLNSSIITITNTIFDGNSANTTGNEIQGSSSTLNMDYSIYSTTLDNVGTNNIGANMLSTSPSFVDAADGDYHLSSGSSGIDTGTASGAPADDIDGTSRPQNGLYDMGAYEFVP